jgi:hypothetical protein
MVAWRKLHILIFQQPSAEFQETKSSLKVDDLIIKKKKTLIFSDVQRIIFERVKRTTVLVK